MKRKGEAETSPFDLFLRWEIILRCGESLREWCFLWRLWDFNGCLQAACFALGLIEGQFTFTSINHDHIARHKITFEELNRKRVFHKALDSTAQRTRSILGIETFFG